MTKVGDALWTEELHGRLGDWHSSSITGETVHSWIVKDAGVERKVNKKTMIASGRAGYGGSRWYTTQGRADYEFVSMWRFKIGSHVSAISDAEKLREVAKIIGFEFS